jgi:hypothetical protein
MNPYSQNVKTVTFNTEKVVENKLDAIISSVRPFSQNAEYAQMQINAIDSWFDVSKKVVLFNLPEDTGNLQRQGLIYVGPESNPPSIKQMLSYCNGLNVDDIVALVNADIMLAPRLAKLPKAVMANSFGRAWACLSRRCVLDTKTDKITPPDDFGLDFFCSTVRIWNDVAKAIPGVLTFGRVVWDNWMNSFLKGYIDQTKYFDLTNWQCVIHPIHGEHFRLNHDNPEKIDSLARSLTHSGMPRKKINIPLA